MVISDIKKLANDVHSDNYQVNDILIVCSYNSDLE